MMPWPGEEDWEQFEKDLDAWNDDECHICGEPDCDGDCWLNAPWLSDDTENGEGI